MHTYTYLYRVNKSLFYIIMNNIRINIVRYIKICSKFVSKDFISRIRCVCEDVSIFTDLRSNI